MTKYGIAAIVAVALALAPRPAHASCGRDCLPGWFDVIGGAVLLGIVGGYAAGTGYFVYRDATDDHQSAKYGATELGVNAGLASLWTIGAFHAESSGERFVYSGLALCHTALAAHGALVIYNERTTIHIGDYRTTLAGTAGMVYAANTLMWTLNASGEHDPSYGVWEAAVNGPLALGLGYLAVEHGRDRDNRYAALYGGMALASAGLTAHGIYTALKPRATGGLDLLGTDVAPSVVSDGREIAPGLAASGTW